MALVVHQDNKVKLPQSLKLIRWAAVRCNIFSSLVLMANALMDVAQMKTSTRTLLNLSDSKAVDVPYYMEHLFCNDWPCKSGWMSTMCHKSDFSISLVKWREKRALVQGKQHRIYSKEHLYRETGQNIQVKTAISRCCFAQNSWTFWPECSPMYMIRGLNVR